MSLDCGRVRGVLTDGVARFLSVPYACPPVGLRRFAPPAPVQPWVDIKDTRGAAGASAPQPKLNRYPRIDIAPIVGPGWRAGDDFLSLNVWAREGAAKKPVMVWIHGGGLVLGSKDAPVTDGHAFARSGVVFVALNYRLGVEGFLPVPGAATNLGLRDVLAGLRWVQDNIEKFGGDAQNVTLFGESGGGMLVSCLVTSPLARNLFQRAIIQSGHGSSAIPLEIAARTVSKIAELLNVTASLEAFRAVDAKAFVKAQGQAAQPGALDLRNEDGFDSGFGLGRFNPVYGDDVLPLSPLQALAQGAGSHVAVLIGSNAEEANFWFVPTGLDRWLPRFGARWLLSKAMLDADKVLAAYGAGRSKSGGRALADALTDLAFRWPSRQFAAVHRGQAHVYEFDWRSPACDGRLGACHGLELPFVFDTLASVGGRESIAGQNPPQALASSTHALWVSFARDGLLPWPAFDVTRRNVYSLSSEVATFESVMPAAAFLPAAPEAAPAVGEQVGGAT